MSIADLYKSQLLPSMAANMSRKDPNYDSNMAYQAAVEEAGGYAPTDPLGELGILAFLKDLPHIEGLQDVQGFADGGIVRRGSKKYKPTREDAEDLARVFQEVVPGSPDAHKEAVGWTVINRMNTGKFADTPKGVIEQVVGGAPQYTLTSERLGGDAYRRYQLPPSEADVDLAMSMLDGTKKDTTDGATGYFNPDLVNPPWAEGLKSNDVGPHRFIREDRFGPRPSEIPIPRPNPLRQQPPRQDPIARLYEGLDPESIRAAYLKRKAGIGESAMARPENPAHKPPTSLVPYPFNGQEQAPGESLMDFYKRSTLSGRFIGKMEDLGGWIEEDGIGNLLSMGAEAAEAPTGTGAASFAPIPSGASDRNIATFNRINDRIDPQAAFDRYQSQNQQKRERLPRPPNMPARTYEGLDPESLREAYRKRKAGNEIPSVPVTTTSIPGNPPVVSLDEFLNRSPKKKRETLDPSAYLKNRNAYRDTGGKSKDKGQSSLMRMNPYTGTREFVPQPNPTRIGRPATPEAFAAADAAVARLNPHLNRAQHPINAMSGQWTPDMGYGGPFTGMRPNKIAPEGVGSPVVLSPNIGESLSSRPKKNFMYARRMPVSSPELDPAKAGGLIGGPKSGKATYGSSTTSKDSKGNTRKTTSGTTGSGKSAYSSRDGGRSISVKNKSTGKTSTYKKNTRTGGYSKVL